MPDAQFEPPGASNVLLEQALAAAPEIVALVDRGGVVLWASRSFTALFGWPEGSVTGRHVSDLALPPRTIERVLRQLEEVAAAKATRLFEDIVPTPSGLRHLEYSITPVAGAAGEMAGFLGIARDVTTQRQEDTYVREQEELFRQVFERGPLGIAISSPDGHILRANARFCCLLGYDESELAGMRIDELTHPDDRELADRMLGRSALTEVPPGPTGPDVRTTNGMPARSGLGSEEASNEARTHVPAGNDPVEVRYLRRDGAPLWVQATRALVTGDAGDVRYVLTMVVDVDARRRAAAEQRAMEERLREMQKLESLGVLAGGIAHDFNNLLVPILGNAELALQELPPSSPLRDGLREIVRAAERAADLARQMLAYSGRSRFVIEPTHLSVLVRDMADLLRASIARGLSLELALAPDLPHVEADASQLRQLLLNLVLNASEAIGPAGGTIVVRTGLLRVTRAFLESAHFAADLTEGDHVFLSVSDTGPGMETDLRGRIFDPFFTTKSPGRGLGLPTVLGIVRGHHGAIHVESEAGRGTTITVVLPSARATREARGANAGEERLPAGRATVLVVEDDVAVRTLTERTLERAGYRVLAAADGAAAVEIVRQRGGEIGCVLLDMMTPRLRGPDACRAIKGLAPGAAVVAMSGFLARDLTGDLGAMVSGVLQKPFTPSMLREAVEAALSK